VWITGPDAGEHRTFVMPDYHHAIETMNILLREGVCAWITEIN
jgi:hypothetical protein